MSDNISMDPATLLLALTTTESTAAADPQLSPPIEFLQVNERSLHNIIAYSVLFLFAATGNLTIFLSIISNNYNKLFSSSSGNRFGSRTTIGTPTRTSRAAAAGLGLRTKSSGKSFSKITLLILHLSIADLIVTFFLIPMEIFWRISVKWIGGNLLCKTCQFGRAFGLYLSSMIIICISLDRYFAIMYPLKQIDAQRRIKRMLIVAWIAAAACSAPQSFIFSVKSHPVYTTFEQCVSIGFFQTQEQEIMYNIFSLSAMYFVPILVILFTYSMVLWKLVRKTREHQQISVSVSNSLRDSSDSVYTIPIAAAGSEGEGRGKQNLTLRTSDNGLNTYSKAKTRTLKLTVVIVVTFLVCAVPYVFMTLWYMFDRESAQQVDGRVQDFFFMMVVANSCMNPLIYGSFGKGNLLWWCNIFGKKDVERKVSASSATIATAPTAVHGHGHGPRDWMERRRQEALHPTLSTTLSSAPMLPRSGARRTISSISQAHAEYAKKKITGFRLFVHKLGACLNLSNHYFHDNIVNHHPTTLIATAPERVDVAVDIVAIAAGRREMGVPVW